MDPRIDAIPFATHVGIQIVHEESGEVRGRLQWKPELCTAGGVMHGGALMALGDTVGAICAFHNLPPGTATGTIESKTNFFRAVREGQVEAVAHPLHVGRSTIVVQTDIYDGHGRRVAQVTQTQAVLGA